MERGGHGGFIGAKRGSGSWRIGLIPGQWRRWLRERECVLIQREEREVWGDLGSGPHWQRRCERVSERRGGRACGGLRALGLGWSGGSWAELAGWFAPGPNTVSVQAALFSERKLQPSENK